MLDKVGRVLSEELFHSTKRSEIMEREAAYLGPFVCLGIVSLHYVQVGLPVITPNSIQLVTE